MESAPEQAGRLRLAITRTARRLRQEADSPLSPTLLAALGTIANHGPLTPSELARRERVQRPNATKVVTRLEQQGLVLRAGSQADGRSTLISPTDAGHRLLADSRTRKDAYLTRRIEALPVEDRQALARAAALLEQML